MLVPKDDRTSACFGPERYWGTRKPGNARYEKDGLSACAGQLSEEMRLLQEPSAGAAAKDAAKAMKAKTKFARMEAAMEVLARL